MAAGGQVISHEEKVESNCRDNSSVKCFVELIAMDLPSHNARHVERAALSHHL